jgi:hypothetical protein
MQRRLPATVSAAQPKPATPIRLLLLPGALLMAMRTQLLAPLMLINLCFSTFF